MKVVASFDDGCELDKKIAQLCLEAGIETIFYIPVDYYSIALTKGYEPLSDKTLKFLTDNFIIGSHTVTHRHLTSLSLKEVRQELELSKSSLEHFLGQKIDSLCYPRGYSNEEIRQIAKDCGYTYGRNTLIGSLQPPQDPLNANTTVHIGCPVRPEYKGSTWLEYAINKIEEAKTLDKTTEDVIYHFWGHAWEIDKYNEWNNVKKFFRLVGKL